MFTGIIESLGIIKNIDAQGHNLNITVISSITNELKIDQSVSHNGICLTVVELFEDSYKVVAIKETIDKTTISSWKLGEKVNLERGLKVGDRLDGHIVQGHVDQKGTCVFIEEQNGSWNFKFKYDSSSNNITITKGSITINGVSLTVVESGYDEFSVAIIPYTYDNTNFNSIKKGTEVNLEFDVVGKYITKLYSNKKASN
jgi:riboflavin synthase